MDLRKLLDESEVTQRKAFLRSFIKKIVVDKEIMKIYYNVPVPPDGKRMETAGVLPIDTPSGPKVTFAKPIESFFELSISNGPSLLEGGQHAQKES